MKNYGLGGLCVSFLLIALFMGFQYDQKNTEVINLQADNSILTENSNNLQGENNSLQSMLTSATQSLNSTKSSLSSANSTVQSLTDSYNNLRTAIMQRDPTTTQVEQYITPSDPSVAQLVKTVAGAYSSDSNTYWAAFQRLLNWVHSNVQYSYDTPIPILPSTPSGNLSWVSDYWRFPSETIKDKAGDCEDQALLLLSLLRNYAPFAFYAIEIGNDSIGHVAVVFPVQGGNLTVLDPVSGYYTSSYGYISSKPAATAIDDYLNTMKNDIPNAKLNFAFNDSVYKSFSSTAEFVTWITS